MRTSRRKKPCRWLRRLLVLGLAMPVFTCHTVRSDSGGTSAWPTGVALAVPLATVTVNVAVWVLCCVRRHVVSYIGAE